MLDIDTVREMIANRKTASDVAAVTGATRRSVLHFAHKHKLGPWFRNASNRKRNPDDAFLKTGGDYTREEAQKKWGVAAETLIRWYKETGIRPRKKHAVAYWTPAEMRAKVGHMNIGEAADFMGVPRNYASKLMREAGLVVEKTARNRTPVYTAPKGQFKKAMGAAPVPINFYVRDMSPEGLAKDCLQRDRWTVFRCDLNGRPMKDGLFWKCGNVVCTDGELLDRADRAARRMGEVVTWRGRLAA